MRVMLVETIRSQITESLKSGDNIRLSALRFLLSDINNTAIAKYGSEANIKLTDNDVIQVVKKQVKSHQESIAAFIKANRIELVDKEKRELVILETFLPTQAPDDKLRDLLEPLIKSGETDFGRLMKTAMSKVGSQADGGRVADLLKQMMSKWRQ